VPRYGTGVGRIGEKPDVEGKADYGLDGTRQPTEVDMPAGYQEDPLLHTYEDGRPDGTGSTLYQLLLRY